MHLVLDDHLQASKLHKLDSQSPIPRLSIYSPAEVRPAPYQFSLTATSDHMRRHFLVLPQELLAEILKQLEVKDLLRCRQVTLFYIIPKRLFLLTTTNIPLTRCAPHSEISSKILCSSNTTSSWQPTALSTASIALCRRRTVSNSS